MSKMLRKVYTAVTKAVDEDTRTLSVIISTDSPDRSGDIVVPKGGNFDNFQKNPVVLYAHNYSGLPIAKCVVFQQNEHDITAQVKFPEKGVYELADIVYEMYKDKFLSAWSIGFIGTKSEPVDEDDDDSWWGPRRFVEWEMLEFSAVPVPANPEALTTVRTLGFNPDIVKDAWKELRSKKQEKKEKTEEKKEKQKEEKPEVKEAEEVKEREVEEPVEAVEDKTEEVIEEKAIETKEKNEPVETPEAFEVKRVDDTHISVKGGDIDLVVDLKTGRTISAKHENMLVQAKTLLETVIASSKVAEDDTDDEKAITPSFIKKIRNNLREQDKTTGLTLRTLNKALSAEGGEK